MERIVGIKKEMEPQMDFKTFLLKIGPRNRKQHKIIVVGHQWLMLIILVTWETEIRRIAVQSKPSQIVCETLISKITKSKHLLCKHRALSSNPSPTKINKQINKNNYRTKGLLQDEHY
jgi:hypothetical protein